ncbi:Leydig cell tumor protein [Schizosaccharomyces pombe]|uniref:UPF0390 protein C24B10.18 n=1 Tax=Schizosaccharomyces pombe (strain 972 / ATCC 24843) TaxID=284812 RepID=U390_SCHPO|nr:uncharacterized protein SPCC24B10.18 [Schizosaccharomyces pombe]Q9P7I8.1 RecName: Full=UPF0390 protein C24B10.18 [Schizosaccharomyces pombe 972h-]CAB76227.1 human Leydig cell tumor 10 kDa protein homolog [Schizosaccharomyces pombe]|eukprot:NP_588021.1 uncharacterized protein SPCC24B10.18 [Schizosaccharomyces pombe]
MAQGEFKKKKNSSANKGGRVTKHSKNPKKGARYCAPRRAAAIKDHTINANITKTLNVRNEKLIAGIASQQVGKLTITKALGEAGAKELKEGKH